MATGRERHLRRTPLFACGASAEVVCEVGNDLLLSDDIFVPRHQDLADVVRNCGKK